MPPVKVSQPEKTAPDARHIAAVLQGESVPIAAATASLFLRRPEGIDLPSSRSEAGLKGAPGAQGLGSLPGVDVDVRGMVEQNFVRLAYAVALAVLVDEPPLVADDLNWVKEMLSWRGVAVVFPSMAIRLFEAFEEASSSYLSPGEAACVADVLGRAAVLLGAQSPLPA